MDDENNHSEKVQVEHGCFSYGFRPIYYFSRVIGLMPYSMVHNKNGEIQEHRIYYRDGLWILTSISLYISVILHVFRDMKLPKDPNSTLYIFILGNAQLQNFQKKISEIYKINMLNVNREYIYVIYFKCF